MGVPGQEQRAGVTGTPARQAPFTAKQLPSCRRLPPGEAVSHDFQDSDEQHGEDDTGQAAQRGQDDQDGDVPDDVADRRGGDAFRPRPPHPDADQQDQQQHDHAAGMGSAIDHARADGPERDFGVAAGAGEVQFDLAFGQVHGQGEHPARDVAIRASTAAPAAATLAGNDAHPVDSCHALVVINEHRAAILDGVSALSVQTKGRSAPDAPTDGRGVASCEVRQVQQSVFTVTRIEARLDLDAMADGVDFSGVTAPAVEFGCVLRARQNSFFALYVDEKTVEGQTRDSQVGSDCVREALSQEGFVLIDDAKVIERVGTDALSGESTPDELAIAFSGLMAAEGKRGFLLLVIGRIGLSLVETTSTSEGELFIVEAAVRLRLIDVSLAAGERTVLS